MDKSKLMSEARIVFEGCAGDMDGWDLEDAASFVADRLYDEYGSVEGGYYKIVLEALKATSNKENIMRNEEIVSVIALGVVALGLVTFLVMIQFLPEVI